MGKIIRRLRHWPRKERRWFGPGARSVSITGTPAANSAATSLAVTSLAASATSTCKSTSAHRIRNLTVGFRAGVLDFPKPLPLLRQLLEGMKIQAFASGLLFSVGLFCASAAQPDTRFDGVWVGTETIAPPFATRPLPNSGAG